MHKVTSHHKCTTVVEFTTATAKVMYIFTLFLYIVFHERDLRKQLFAHRFYTKSFPYFSVPGTEASGTTVDRMTVCVNVFFIN